MGIRERHGLWHYRFWIKGKEYAKSTGLEATKQNENAAKAIEAHARLEAQHGEQPKYAGGMPFTVAASEFLAWCHGTQYRRHPNTAKRISGSFASLTEFFRDSAVEDVADAGVIEKYKTHRFTVHYVKDVTVRNDLNALSLFFGYAKQQKWCKANPLLGEDKVKRPSAEDAVRMHILTIDEELLVAFILTPLFTTALLTEVQIREHRSEAGVSRIN